MQKLLLYFFLFISYLSFGQIKDCQISLDSTRIELNLGRDPLFKYLLEKDTNNVKYSIYNNYQIIKCIDSKNEYIKHIDVGKSQTYYINFIYHTCWSGDFVDNDKLKLIITNQDTIFNFKLFDPSNKIIQEFNSSSLSPIILEGKSIKYYENGNKRTEGIYLKDTLISEIFWTKNGNEIDSVYYYRNDSIIDKSDDYFMKYIMENIKFPSILREIGFMGRVYISYILTKEGKVECEEIIYGINPILDNIFLNLIQNAKPISPSYINNRAVNVKCIRNIYFIVD